MIEECSFVCDLHELAMYFPSCEQATEMISYPWPYNLFLSGPAGVGKTTTIETILSSIAKEKVTPHDWCYVFNFEDPNEPKAIELPNGEGKDFKKDMDDFLQVVESLIHLVHILVLAAIP